MTDAEHGRNRDDRRPGAGRRETYRGHEIFFPDDPRRKRIFVDGRPVRHGTAGGKHYLDVYAYDRADSLDDVVRRYIDYLEPRDDKSGS